MRLPLPLASSLAAALLGASGCGPKEETLHPIAAERAPILPEAESDEHPLAVLRRGDLVARVRSLQPLDWKGSLDGQDATRSGELLEVRRAPAETAGLVFASDLGEPVKVPAAAWLCRQMGAPTECEGRLHRILLGDRLVAYDPCSRGSCQVAVIRDRRVAALAIDGLTDLHPEVIEGQQVLVATSRWVRHPLWTGADKVVLRVGDSLERALCIHVEDVDGRSPPSIQRMGALTIENGALTFRGTRRLIGAADGRIILSDAIHEVYHLAKKEPRN
ncbi:MAG: hypothetical protein EXR72_19540 [Myxococcales bacterium]|nr:hypothetical protein [Myxococcales bacterium]